MHHKTVLPACLSLLLTLGCDQPLTFDAQGVARGTGERTYTYKSGATQLREEYVRGELVRSRWFKPDGALVQETKWIDGTGEGIYLREDGSVRARVPYVDGVADGEATNYDEAGRPVEVVTYRRGRRVSERPPTTSPTTAASSES